MKFQNAVAVRSTVVASARRREAGVTMIELLIVIMIAGVLAVIAAPSLQSVMRTMRQNSALGLLMSDLNLARGEAIKRNSRMLVCARNTNGTDCSTNWAAGWVVCGEGAVNQCAASTATMPNPIAVRSPLDASLTLSASASSGVTGVAVVRFSPDSTQTSEKVAGTRDGRVDMVLGGTWSGATSRTVQVANTGNISKQ